MAVRKITFIFWPMPLKKGAKYDKQEGEAFRDLLSTFYVCDDCNTVLLSDEGEPECPPCRIRYGQGGKK